MNELLLKKKKKKPKVYQGFVEETEEAVEAEYHDLLKRIYEKNPFVKRPKFIVKAPQIVKISIKKTSFVNFFEISSNLNRNYQHFQSFILSELSTTGSIDSRQHLVLKGRFNYKHFEKIIKNYIKEYVICDQCKSRDTYLSFISRLTFLKCENCKSSYSVSPISRM